MKRNSSPPLATLLKQPVCFPSPHNTFFFFWTNTSRSDILLGTLGKSFPCFDFLTFKASLNELRKFDDNLNFFLNRVGPAVREEERLSCPQILRQVKPMINKDNSLTLELNLKQAISQSCTV